MTELDHVQADVLKDLSKMLIAGAGIIVLLGLLLWGLVTSAEAAGLVTVRSHDVSNDSDYERHPTHRQRPHTITAILSPDKEIAPNVSP